MNTLSYVKKQGTEILLVFDDLAQLRFAVFKDYPYLYEGTVAYEKDYLQPYVLAKHALLNEKPKD